MSKIKPLPIEQQIKILEVVKQRISDKRFRFYGLCIITANEISCKSKNYNFVLCSEIPEYIPMFTRLNAIAWAQRYGYKKPYINADYWWTIGSRKHRLLFLDA